MVDGIGLRISLSFMCVCVYVCAQFSLVKTYHLPMLFCLMYCTSLLSHKNKIKKGHTCKWMYNNNSILFFKMGAISYVVT